MEFTMQMLKACSAYANNAANANDVYTIQKLVLVPDRSSTACQQTRLRVCAAVHAAWASVLKCLKHHRALKPVLCFGVGCVVVQLACWKLALSRHVPCAVMF